MNRPSWTLGLSEGGLTRVPVFPRVQQKEFETAIYMKSRTAGLVIPRVSVCNRQT